MLDAGAGPGRAGHAGAPDRVRLVLIGDSEQLQPIDGGALFRSLGDALGRVEVTEVLRQSEPWEREALTAFRQGDVSALVGRYLEEGRVQESPTESSRIAAMAAEWVAATTEQYDCIAVARERATVAELNAATRHAAIQAGLVAPYGESRRCVDDVGRKRIDLGELEFAPGDRILVVGRNDRSLGLVKGMRGTVTEAWINGALVVEPTDAPGHRLIIPASYDGVAHGYAMTAHRAQGITVDISLVHGADAAERQWQYVALSRHRMRCRYFDLEASRRDVDGVHHGYRQEPTIQERLVQVMSRHAVKASTLDYPREYQRQLHVQEAERGPAGGLHARPTVDQLDALVRLGWRDALPVAATWIHASVVLEQASAGQNPPQLDVRHELEGLGLSTREADAAVAQAHREVERPGRSPAVPAGYGAYYRAHATRQLWNDQCKQWARQPRNPVSTHTDPSDDYYQELIRQCQRHRRSEQQRQHDHELRRRRERDHRTSVGMS